MPESPDSSHRARRAALTAVLIASGLAIHLAVQRLAPAPIARDDDRLVGLLPFLPWTVWIYLLFFPLLVTAGALVPAERWLRLAVAWTLASVVTWGLVLLVPVTFPRPDPAGLGEPYDWVFGALYGADPAHVTFPCLHSAVTWISWLALRDRGRRLSVALFVLALAIAVSTMTTRQHLLTDNVAALAIAWASARLALPGATAGSRVGEEDQGESPRAASGSRS